MKKIYTLLLVLLFSVFYSQSYWKRVSGKKTFSLGAEQTRPEDLYYRLDVKGMMNSLESSNTSVKESSTGKTEKLIEVPLMNGKIETFRVMSLPVMEGSLAQKYKLMSFTGVSVNDPYVTIRMSLSPNKFQSTILNRGTYEFIDGIMGDKTLYRVHYKTNKTKGDKPFECTTDENEEAKKNINKLFKRGKISPLNKISAVSKDYIASDTIYRTYKIAFSVTGEYTQFFGGKEAALEQINATLTRVNSVYEKDLAIHLVMVDAPQLIYEDPATDPYSDAKDGARGAWNAELQKTLTEKLGEDKYDLGHLLGASGGGGNAGCIGCVCISPTVKEPLGKGSGFTSPANQKPYGDEFDIDYVAHEIGHQLGANHTFTYRIESTSAQIEPGSGSTIMGYAGITDSNVQEHSDPYFSVASLRQIKNNKNIDKCGTSSTINENTPPVIEKLPSYSIPKGTAFVLKAKATDVENDPLTYTWEENDLAYDKITNVSDQELYGPNFRSILPSNNPVRYFPALESVMDGKLVNIDGWETVSNVARDMKFSVVVRDNNPDPSKQQMSYATQKISVKEDGPFAVTNKYMAYTSDNKITWDVANTNNSPYNVANVKIDYTTDKGKTWTTIVESTPNNGSYDYNFPEDKISENVQVRVSSIGNVFYAVSTPLEVVKPKECDGNAPKIFVEVNDAGNLVITWQKGKAESYVIRYKLKSDSEWTEIAPVSNDENTYMISGLKDSVPYEVQLAEVCSDGTQGAFSESKEFTILPFVYCDLAANSTEFEYISNVKIIDSDGNIILDNTSSNNNKGYNTYTTNDSKLVALKKGSKDNKISITISYPGEEDYYETLSAWIDFNGDGVMSEDERIVESFIPDPSNGNVKTVIETYKFDVPDNSYTGKRGLRLRVALKVGPSIHSVSSSSCDGALKGSLYTTSLYRYGEVEDYKVNIEK